MKSGKVKNKEKDRKVENLKVENRKVEKKSRQFMNKKKLRS